MNNITELICESPIGRIKYNNLKEPKAFKGNLNDQNTTYQVRKYNSSVSFEGDSCELFKEQLDQINNLIYSSRNDNKLQKNLNLYKIDPENEQAILLNFSRKEASGSPMVIFENGEPFTSDFIPGNSEVRVFYKIIPYSQTGFIKFQLQLEKLIIVKLSEKGSELCKSIDNSKLPVAKDLSIFNNDLQHQNHKNAQEYDPFIGEEKEKLYSKFLEAIDLMKSVNQKLTDLLYLSINYLFFQKEVLSINQYIVSLLLKKFLNSERIYQKGPLDLRSTHLLKFCVIKLTVRLIQYWKQIQD